MQKLLLIGLIGLGFSCTSAGTNGTPESPVPPETRPPAKAANMEISSPKPPEGDPTHVVVSDTQYYISGPQQASPPDGTLVAGTKVFLTQENGSYVIVQTVAGVIGHISAGAIKPID